MPLHGSHLPVLLQLGVQLPVCLRETILKSQPLLPTSANCHIKNYGSRWVWEETLMHSGLSFSQGVGSLQVPELPPKRLQKRSGGSAVLPLASRLKWPWNRLLVTSDGSRDNYRYVLFISRESIWVPFCFCDKVSWMRQLNGGELILDHSSRSESITAEKLQWQELEGAGCVVSIIGNRGQ